MESVGSIIAYWLIVAAIVVFSVLTVTTRKILRSATYLLFTLFATAALYFKLLNLLKRRTLGRDDKLHKHPRYREYEGGRNKGCYKQYP